MCVWQHSLVRWTAVGLGLGLAVTSVYTWWLAVPSLALLWHEIQRSPDWRALVGYSLWAGTLKALISLQWFFTSYPLDWLGLNLNWLGQLLLISAYWIPVSVALGTGVAGFAVAVWALQRFTARWVQLGGTLIAFPMSEALGAVMFSIYMIGPGSGVQPFFSFGHIGYSLAAHPWLLQAASLGGVYALSILALALALCCVWLGRRSRYGLLVVGAGVIVTSFISVPTSAPAADTVRVAVVGGAWPRTQTALEDRELKATALGDSLAAAARVDPDYVLLPEDARLTMAHDSTTATLERLQGQFPSQPVVIDSGRVDTSDGTFLRGFVYDLSASDVHIFDKQYLVPQGEYVPSVYHAVLQAFPLSETTRQALRDAHYQPGIAQTTVDTPAYIPPVLFCFESVTPFGVRRINAADTPFVAYVTSHSWFKGVPHTLRYQLDAMLQTQAVWNRAHIVHAGNHNPSTYFTPRGTRVTLEPVASGAHWSVSVLEIPRPNELP